MEKVYEILELNRIQDEIRTYCACTLGKNKVDQMKMYDNYDELILELEKVKEAEQLVFGYGRLPLGGLHDIRVYLKKANIGGILYPQELLEIADTISAVHQIILYEKNSELETPHFTEMVESLFEIDSIRDRILYCVARDGSIYDHASSELGRIRKAISRMQQSIVNKMNSLLVSEKDYLSESLITTRNDRYVLPVNVSYKNQVKGIVHAQSASNKSAYIEPESVVILNNELADEKMNEQREIERILLELSERIKKEYKRFMMNMEVLEELDYLFARGTYGKEHDCAIATVIEECSKITLKKARHPLIDPKKVVSNDILMSQPNHILLITGSNTGGKTVTLKTVGLLSLMTLCALPVPADEAIIPFFDAIYCDLGDGQSIVESLSTFSSHVKQLVNITENITPRSLVLIDEVGSGTDPREGECLAQAILEYIHRYECMCIASTHYSGLKKYAKETSYIQFASVEFDIDTLTPTYRLLTDVIGHSYALEISSKLGLADLIVQRARDIKDQSLSQEDILMEKLENELEENRQLESKLNAALAEATKKVDRYNKMIEKLTNQRERILDEAKEEADKYIVDTRNSVNQIVEDLKAKAQEVKLHEVVEAKTQMNAMISKKEDKTAVGDENYEYKVGDRVILLSMNREGSIIDIAKNGTITVGMGSLKMRVKKKEISYVGKPVKQKIQASKKPSVKTSVGHYECNVIGMRYEEAMNYVDKFLDDALVHRYPSVRIIHGVGTGALRNGIRKMLDKNKHVVSYRNGGPNEGGLGATLVYFE